MNQILISRQLALSTFAMTQFAGDALNGPLKDLMTNKWKKRDESSVNT